MQNNYKSIQKKNYKSGTIQQSIQRDIWIFLFIYFELMFFWLGVCIYIYDLSNKKMCVYIYVCIYIIKKNVYIYIYVCMYVCRDYLDKYISTTT